MEKSENCNEIFAAMSRAQAKMTGAKKDATNPHLNSKYADLQSVIDAIREPFTSEGLCISQCPEFENGLIKVTTMIGHTSGQWIKSTLSAVPTPMPKKRGSEEISSEKVTLQAVGSAITYLKRYGLQAMGLIPSEDDDGETDRQLHGQESNRVGDENKPPTDKQMGFMKDLAIKAGFVVPKERHAYYERLHGKKIEVVEDRNGIPMMKISYDDASAIITKLKEEPKKKEAQKEQQPQEAPTEEDIPY